MDSIEKAEKILQLVRDNNKEDLEKFLETVGSIANIPFPTCPLHVAIRSGHTECAKLLIQSGVDTNVHNEKGEVPIMRAIERGMVGVVHSLLDVATCKTSAVSTMGENVLHFICKRRDPSPDRGRWVPILVKICEKKEVDIHTRDMYGEAPLMYAISAYYPSQDLSIIQALLQFCCTEMTLTESGYQHLLHRAIFKYADGVVPLLIERGMDVDTEGHELRTPLMCAIMRPLYSVSFNGTLSIVEHLIGAGANVNKQDKFGMTALHYSITSYLESHNRRRLVSILLEAGADVNMANSYGETPLWLIIKEGANWSDSLDVIYQILIHNPDLNKSCRGSLLFKSGPGNNVYEYESPVTALEFALDIGYFSAAKLILLAGGDIGPNLVGDDVSSDKEYDSTPEELLWIQKFVLTPSSLVNLCRKVIRVQLGTQVRSKVMQLPVPNSVQDFLLLNDLPIPASIL